MVYDKTVGKVNQPILGVLDADIERNSFGTQRESFETDLKISVLGDDSFKGIFIRAPVVKNRGRKAGFRWGCRPDRLQQWQK